MNGLHTRNQLVQAASLGTPLMGERLKAQRREQLYERAFRLAGLIVCVCVGLAVGYNAALKREALEQAILSVPRAGDGKADQGIPLAVRQRQQAARLAMGKRVCALDSLGCLVCISKPAPGQAVVSTHC